MRKTQSVAALLPRSSHETDMLFNMSDDMVQLLHPFASRYNALLTRD